MKIKRIVDLITKGSSQYESNPQILNKKAKTILAIDLGGTTGWAIWKDGEVSSGSMSLVKGNSRRFEGPGIRFVRFSRWLSSLPRPDIVGFEAVRRHLGVDAAHAYGGYLSHLTAFCDSQTPQIPYEGIGVGTIKKKATGSGSASKEEMINSCRSRLKIEPGDDNEADALWLLTILAEAESLPWPTEIGPELLKPESRKGKKRHKRQTIEKQ